jgi:hypothetical protein
MSKNYEFYPMITRTVKTLIGIVSKNEEKKFLLILQNYPNIQVVDVNDATPLLLALVQELDRQYTRWNKEGDDGK